MSTLLSDCNPFRTRRDRYRGVKRVFCRWAICQSVSADIVGNRGLRIMPVDNYCVSHIPDPENKIVSIIRIMYGDRNIDTELAKHTTG